MDLSVVIPLYNTEKYIEKCIISTQEQDIDPQRYEIIVVNDGSTDHSADIANDVAARYINVKVLTKSNGGLSDARNYGLDHACGDYILFLDSDDYFKPNVFAEIVHNMKSDSLDILSMDYIAVDEGGQEVQFGPDQWRAAKPHSVVSGREFLLLNSNPVMVYLYCYRREFLQGQALRFHNYWHEDEEFTPRALCLCSAIKHTDLCVYCYLQRSDSFTKDYKTKNLFDILYAAKSLKQFAHDRVSHDPELYYFFMNRSALLVITTIEVSIRRNMKVEQKLIKSARKLGVLPIWNPMKSGRRGMLNRVPWLYIVYTKRRTKR